MGAMGRKLDLVTLVLLILEFISWLVYMAATGESTGVGQRCSLKGWLVVGRGPRRREAPGQAAGAPAMPRRLQ